MFQYAAGFALAQKHDYRLMLDTRWLERNISDPLFVKRDYGLSVFNISTKVLSGNDKRATKHRAFGPTMIGRLETRVDSMLRPLGFSRRYIESTFGFKEIPPPSKIGFEYVSGFFQSAKYFEGYESDLKREFSFSNRLSTEELELKSRIQERSSLCLNVRRGDFVNNPRSAAMHGSVPVSYFERAIAESRERIGKLPVYVFSDDVDWCAQNLKHLADVTFVSHRYAGPHFSTYLQLMAACDAFIIPNSTFAWWAVWLSGVEETQVTAPKRWFVDNDIYTGDLIPAGWIRI